MAVAATMAAASEAAAGWEAAAGAMEAMVGGGEASAEQVGAGSKHSCRRHEARSYRYNTMSRNDRGHAQPESRAEPRTAHPHRATYCRTWVTPRRP